MEWSEVRCGKFTASEIHKLLVKGKKTEFGEVANSYIKKKAIECLVPLDLIPKIEGKSLNWGVEHEAEANEVYSSRYMFDGDVTYYGGENPRFFPLKGYEDYAGGSPDAIHGDILVEYKCPYNPEVHFENLRMTAEEFKTERKEYYAQIQFNLMCTGLKKARFVSYDPRFSDVHYRLAVIEIEKDESFCEMLLSRIELAKNELIKLLN